MKNILASAILSILFVMLFVPSGSNAGCPTDVIPTSIPWTQRAAIQDTLSATCILSIFYCDRTVIVVDSIIDSTSFLRFDTIQVVERAIDSIVFNDTSCLSGWGPLNLIHAAANYLFLYNLGSLCTGDVTKREKLYMPPCFKMFIAGHLADPPHDPIFAFQGCNNDSTHCVRECTICPMGAPVDCTWYIEGKAAVCNTPPATWNLNTCYSVGCSTPH